MFFLFLTYQFVLFLFMLFLICFFNPEIHRFLGLNEGDPQSVFQRGTSESLEHERGNVTTNLCI